MNGVLRGKVAVVTGGSRGIGRFIAAALHEAGANVAITSRHEDACLRAAAAIGERCHPFACDQRDPAAIAKLALEVSQQLGAPDILVNNAAVGRAASVLETSLEMWHEIIETNLTGVFLTCQAFLPLMLDKDRADIVMIGSMSGKKGDPGMAAYAASKFGLQGFAQALLYEVRQSNIRVMVLNPSSVDKDDDDGPRSGPGLHLHAADLAATVVHLVTLPGRTMIRDLDVWGTNP